jgi:hypothetical protein
MFTLQEYISRAERERVTFSLSCVLVDEYTYVVYLYDALTVDVICYSSHHRTPEQAFEEAFDKKERGVK